MMRMRSCCWVAAWLACLGLVLPAAPAAAQSPQRPNVKTDSPQEQPAITDVALRSTGGLYGIVVDAQGSPMDATEVVVSQGGKVITRTTTDSLGQFSTQALRGGVYQVTAGQGGTTLRVWDAKAAPPSARAAALVIGNPNVVRGQIPLRKVFVSDAFIIAAIVGAAIAIPIAVSAARNPKPSSS